MTVPSASGDYWVSFPKDSGRTEYTKPKIITLEIVWTGDREEMLYVAESHTGIDYVNPIPHAIYKRADVPTLPDTKSWAAENVYEPLKSLSRARTYARLVSDSSYAECLFDIGSNGSFSVSIIETKFATDTNDEETQTVIFKLPYSKFSDGSVICKPKD